MIYLIYQNSCDFCGVAFPEEKFQVRQGEILPFPHGFFREHLLCDLCSEKFDAMKDKLIKDILKSKKAKK